MTDSITKLDLQVLDIESNSEAATEIGPLKYISKLLNKPMDNVVNWFILVFIFVFDPFAVILLISANRAFQIANEDKKYSIYKEVDEPDSTDNLEIVEEEPPIKEEPQIEISEKEKNRKKRPWTSTKVIS